MRKKKRLVLKEKKKLTKECWSLDIAFYKWLREHLTVYLRDAGKMVDLEYHKFEVDGAEYSQLEIIKAMLTILDSIEELGAFDWAVPEGTTMEEVQENQEDLKRMTSDLCTLWAIILPAMWW